ARTRLAVNQDIDICLRNEMDGMENFAHRLAAPHDIVKRMLPNQLPLKHPVLFTQTFGFQKMPDSCKKLLRERRLCNVIRYTQLDALDRGCGGWVLRKYEKRQVRVMLTSHPKELQSIV